MKKCGCGKLKYSNRVRAVKQALWLFKNKGRDLEPYQCESLNWHLATVRR